MSTRLHSKYGLNPSLTNCYYCGEPDKIILVGSATKKFKEAGLCSDDGEMNHDIGVIDMEPCNKCKEYMDQGIILISVKEGEEPTKNPYRTGGWVVVRKSFLENAGIKPPSLVKTILKQRFCFIPDDTWRVLGLPRGAVDGIPTE